MKRTYRVFSVVVHYALKLAALAGVSESALRNAARITREALEDPEGMIPYNQYLRVFSEGARMSGNEFLWLQKLNPGILSANNVTMYYAFNAPDIKTSLDRSKSTYLLINEALFPDYKIRRDEFAIQILMRAPNVEYSEYIADWGLSQWHGLAMLFAGSGAPLRSIRTTATSKERLRAYQEYFQVPVEGGQSCEELVFPKGTENAPNARGASDPNLDLFFGRLIEQMLENVMEVFPFEKILIRAIQKELKDGNPSLERIAAQLGMTGRTLQRKLAEHDLMFSDVLLRHRLALAASYLEQPELSVSEVASLVGYGKLGSFSSAFQKRHGMTPTDYRKKHLAE